jgi:hypothetical protein
MYVYVDNYVDNYAMQLKRYEVQSAELINSCASSPVEHVLSALPKSSDSLTTYGIVARVLHII